MPGFCALCTDSVPGQSGGVGYWWLGGFFSLCPDSVHGFCALCPDSVPGQSGGGRVLVAGVFFSLCPDSVHGFCARAGGLGSVATQSSRRLSWIVPRPA